MESEMEWNLKWNVMECNGIWNLEWMEYELTLIVIYRGKLYCIFNLFLCCFRMINPQWIWYKPFGCILLPDSTWLSVRNNEWTISITIITVIVIIQIVRPCVRNVAGIIVRRRRHHQRRQRRLVIIHKNNIRNWWINHCQGRRQHRRHRLAKIH